MIENRTILDASDLDGFDKVNDFVTDTNALNMLKVSTLCFILSFHKLSSSDLLPLLCREMCLILDSRLNWKW